MINKEVQFSLKAWYSVVDCLSSMCESPDLNPVLKNMQIKICYDIKDYKTTIFSVPTDCERGYNIGESFEVIE